MSAPRSLPRHLEPYLDTVVGPRMFNTVRTVNGVVTSRHKGIDFACPTGIPLEAGMDGEISLVGGSMTHQWGYYVHVICDCPLKHVQEFHILRDKPTFYIGQRIKAGQHIGFTGRSGSLGGKPYFAHHHHGTSVNGTYFDPLRIGWPGLADTDTDIPIDNEVEDMTPEQDTMLRNIYTAIFLGGPSMSDGGRSIEDSLAGLVKALDTVRATVTQNVSRSVHSQATLLPADGTPINISQYQDTADINSMLRQLMNRPVTTVEVQPIVDAVVAAIEAELGQIHVNIDTAAIAKAVNDEAHKRSAE